MILITRQLPDNHNIILTGDHHLGSVLVSDTGWEKMIHTVHSSIDGLPISSNFVIDMGDMIEAIMVDDKRFSPEMLTQPLPMEQMKAAIAARTPIAQQILYAHTGNHERKLWRYGDITEMVCDGLRERNKSIQYGTFSAKFTAIDEHSRLMYKIFTTHGRKTITSTADDPKRRRSNMELILKRQLKFKHSDCVAMFKAHAHKLLTCCPEFEVALRDDGARIRQMYPAAEQHEAFIHPDLRWYGCTGSYLRMYKVELGMKPISGYAELAELDPVELGFLILKVRDQKVADIERRVLDL